MKKLIEKEKKLLSDIGRKNMLKMITVESSKGYKNIKSDTERSKTMDNYAQ